MYTLSQINQYTYLYRVLKLPDGEVPCDRRYDDFERGRKNTYIYTLIFTFNRIELFDIFRVVGRSYSKTAKYLL